MPAGDQLPIGEILVAFSNNPVLAIWQAMKRLSEVNARTDAADISEILAEAETMLFGLILTLIKRPEIAGSISVPTAREGSGVTSPFAINGL
jgi:hypothetical protein